MKSLYVPALLLAALLCPAVADADLVLAVETFTSSELKFSISGTFDEDVIGDQGNWLAIKSDYRNNVGVNVDWLTDSEQLYSNYSVLTNTVGLNGGSSLHPWASLGTTYGDSIYFTQPANFVAGDSISGMFHMTHENNGFKPSASPLELASGFNNATDSWARFEAVATSSVPEPTSAILLSGSLLGMLIRRRRTK